MARAAVFLDRDNTIIADPGYLSDPDEVSLLPGAGQSIRRLNKAGYAVVVVTNQSGVARGMVSEHVLGEIHDRLREVLLEQGARLDGVYYCPYLEGDDAVVEQYRRRSDLRKPEPGMLLRAARELDLDLDRSWMIGDSARDVEAGVRAGCRAILVQNGQPSADSSGSGSGSVSGSGVGAVAVAGSLEEAVTILLEKPSLLEKSGVLEKPEQLTSAPGGSETRAAAEHSPGGSPVGGDDRVVDVLEEIRDVLKRGERAARFEDFSFARLAGTLAQMLALVAGGWGIAALLAGSEAALVRLVLAGFLQLVALTAFAGGKRR